MPGGRDAMRVQPSPCANCGEVIGVYEPLVAVHGGGQTINASLLTLDPDVDLRHAHTYHSACFSKPGPATRGRAET